MMRDIGTFFYYVKRNSGNAPTSQKQAGFVVPFIALENEQQFNDDIFIATI